jgi:hypothetical protein
MRPDEPAPSTSRKILFGDQRGWAHQPGAYQFVHGAILLLDEKWF